MAFLDQLIALLALTDGRDKLYKFLAGVFKIFGALAKKQQQLALGSACEAMGASIGSARSVMRMGKFVGDVPKLKKLGDVVSTKPNLKTVIEILRTIGNSLYIMGDNVAFVAKQKLIRADAKCVTKCAKTAQFWGFFFAAVLDLFALTAAQKKKSTDPSTYKKEQKAALLGLAKDGSDTLVTMAAVGYFKSIWHPCPVTAGALTCVSGGIATYTNWKKAKK